MEASIILYTGTAYHDASDRRPLSHVLVRFKSRIIAVASSDHLAIK